MVLTLIPRDRDSWAFKNRESGSFERSFDTAPYYVLNEKVLIITKKFPFRSRPFTLQI